MLQEDPRSVDIHRFCRSAWSIVLRRHRSDIVRAWRHVVGPQRSCDILLHVYQDKAQSQSRKVYGPSEQTFVEA